MIKIHLARMTRRNTVKRYEQELGARQWTAVCSKKWGKRSCKLDDSEAVKLAKLICTFYFTSIIVAKARNAVFTAS